MDKCREAFEKNRFWVGIFRADVVFKSEIGEFGLYEALNSKVEAEYLVEFNNKWVIWYQCWQSRQSEVDQLKKQLHEQFEINLKLAVKVDKKDKRINQALKHADLNFWNATTVELMVKTLRGEHE